MAATSLISSLSAPSSSPPQLTPSIGSPKSSFLHGTKLLCQPSSFSALSGRPTAPRFLVSSSAKSFDHIPNQFREENLKDGCESLSLSALSFDYVFISRMPLLAFLNLVLYFRGILAFGVDLFWFWLNRLSGFSLILSSIG